MKIFLLIANVMLVGSLFGQVLDGAQQTNMFVHANKGLSFRAAPSPNADKIETLSYGTEVVIAEYIGEPIEINGFTGRWTKLYIDKQEGYVFDAYLSDWPVVITEDFHPHLSDYIYAMGDWLDGDKTCTIDDNTLTAKSTFEQGDYQFTGDECDADETLNLKDISVQEAYIIFSGFIPSYGGFSFTRNNFTWDQADGVFMYDFTNNDDQFSRWYHVTCTRDEQDEFDYIEVYFDWEGGGGWLKITENAAINGVVVKKYYGCH